MLPTRVCWHTLTNDWSALANSTVRGSQLASKLVDGSFVIFRHPDWGSSTQLTVTMSLTRSVNRVHILLKIGRSRWQFLWFFFVLILHLACTQGECQQVRIGFNFLPVQHWRSFQQSSLWSKPLFSWFGWTGVSWETPSFPISQQRAEFDFNWC